MFDSLKKRLKDALSRASSAIGKEEKKEAEKPTSALPAEEVKAAEKEEPTAEIKEPEKEIVVPAPKEAKVLEEEPIKEEALQMPTAVKEKKEERKEKKSIIHGLIKRVVEKKLAEEDIEPVLRELRRAFLENDVALETAEKICGDVRTGLIGKHISRGKIEETIRDALRSALLDVMKQQSIDIENAVTEKWRESKQPYVIMFFGFNGTGKTTTISKFANRYKRYLPVLAAGDTFRAASIEQLEEHAKRLGVDLIKHKYGSDSAAVIFDAIKHAAAKGSKLVIADTAGRSHSNVNLMDELKKVVRVNKPDLKILVLDALTGNDIYDQSRLFNEAVGVDAIILTKTDVYDKGGAALSASHTIKKPILFLGTGQNYDDLKEFNAEEIVKNLLG